MRALICYLLNALLLGSMSTALRNGDAGQISRRALPLRPPKVPEPIPNDLPKPRPISNPPKAPPPNTFKPPEVVETLGTDQLSPNRNSEGTAPESNNLCYRDKEGCQEMLEKAAELVKELVSNAVDAGGSSDSTTTSSPTKPTSSTGSTSSDPTNSPMLNANVSSWMDLQHYSAQFTAEEFSMLKDSPVCFFGHMEALYEAYANFSSSMSSESATRTATSSSKMTNAPVRRGDPLDCLQNPEAASCTAAQSSESSESAATDLYLTYLPSQISLVYRSTPTSLEVTATSTTSCSSLGNMTSFETTYAFFGYKAGFEPTSTSTNAPGPTTSPNSGNEVAGNAMVIRPSLCAVAALAIALFMCMA